MGDFTLIGMFDYTLTSGETPPFINQWDNGAGGSAYDFYYDVDNDHLKLRLSDDGSTVSTLTSNTANLTTNEPVWLRVQAVFGASLVTVSFFKSEDPFSTAIGDISWTALGTPTASITEVHTTAEPLRIGARDDGAASLTVATGDIYRSQVYVGTLAGTLISEMYPDRDYLDGATFTSSTTSEIYTLQGDAAVNVQ